MAMQVLTTYRAHDVCHDLESAVWLLLCTVLSHTLQVMEGNEDSEPEECERYKLYLETFDATTERGSFDKKNTFVTNPIEWEGKGNKPLTLLIRQLCDLVYKQNCNPRREKQIPLTYKSVLSTFNQALALPGWPENDAALPLHFPAMATAPVRKKRAREDDNFDSDDDAEVQQRASKRPLVGPSPLRNEVAGTPVPQGSNDWLDKLPSQCFS